MNPFNLSGPEFLVFYILFSAVVLVVAWHFRRQAESGPTPRMDLSDPYLIACLRGGETEALRLGVLALIDRGLLIADNTWIGRAAHATQEDTHNAVEAAVLRAVGTGTTVSSILNDVSLREECRTYREKLEEEGLLPDESTKSQRWRRFLLASMALAGVGVNKIAIGLSRDRPVVFLFILTIAAVIVLAGASFPRLTARGRQAIDDIQAIYGGLKDRACDIHRGSATAEMLMLVAVFSVTALPPTEYAFARTIFPQTGRWIPQTASWIGGGDGSCGGGGCGGGGCGAACCVRLGGRGGCGACGWWQLPQPAEVSPPDSARDENWPWEASLISTGSTSAKWWLTTSSTLPGGSVDR